MSNMSNLTTPLLYSPSRERNEAKYGYLSTPQCICCKKPLNEGTYYSVHMGVYGDLFDVSLDENLVEELTGQPSQGWFEIGKSCAKKFPSNFIMKG